MLTRRRYVAPSVAMMSSPSVSISWLELDPRGGRVPVTAKLSRKFYEKLGDDVAGELVDWFNAVDSTYKSELKEMNELNWQRFKATLHEEISSLRAESPSLRAEISTLRAELRGEM